MDVGPPALPLVAPPIEELLRQRGWMCRLAQELAGGSDADDLVQDACLAALERPPRHGANLGGWLARVLSNRTRSRARSERRRRRREAESVRAETDAATDELLAELELQRRVASAVRELDEPYRTVLLLRFYRDLSPTAIAAMQGVPAATVRSHLKRGLDQLRARFDREHGGDRRAWSLAMLAWATPERVAAPAASLLVLWSVLALLGFGTAGALVLRSLESAPSSVLDPLASTDPIDAHAPPEGASAPETMRSIAPTAAREAAPPLAAPAHVAETCFIGSVRAPDGSPIAGALLSLQEDVGQLRRSPPLAQGTSDASGRFAIPAAGARSRAYAVWARAEGFHETFLASVRPGEELALELAWLTELSGIVRDAETELPIAGATVSSGSEAVLSEADGRYRLTAVPVGCEVLLTATHPRYVLARERLRLSQREPRTRDLDLAPGIALELELVDRESGAPLAGVNVEGRPGLASDADGRLALRIATGEDLDLEFRRADLAPARWGWTVDTRETSAPPRVRLPLQGRAWIEGRVRDEDGRPIAGAWLYVENDGAMLGLFRPEPGESPIGTLGYREDLHSRQASDADGHFRLAAVPTATPFELQVGHAAFVATTSRPFRLTRSGERVELELVLARGATIRGRVLENGEPFTRASIRASDPAGAFLEQATIDPDGRYELCNVRPGEVVLTLSDDGSERLATTLTVEKDRSYEHDFAWETELLPITGRVLDARGVPAAGAFVSASPELDGGRWGIAVTASDGSFRLHVPPGTGYDVIAETRAGALQCPAQRVEPGASGLELVLPTAGRLRLALVDASTGAPARIRNPEDGSVQLRRAGGDPYQGVPAEIDLDGVLEIRRPAGPLDLRLAFRADGFQPLERLGLAIPPDLDSAPIRIELEPGIELRLRFEPGPASAGPSPFRGHLVFLLARADLSRVSGPYPSQDPPSNHRINGTCMRLERPDLLEERLPLYDDVGFVVRRGLAPGAHFLRAFPDDLLFEPAEFELAGPEPHELTVRWRAR